MPFSIEINVSEYLNFALFLRDAAGLLRYQGYIGREFRWPFNECEFLKEAGIPIFTNAFHQWNEWWLILLRLAKEETISGILPYSYLDDISTGTFYNLDKFQDLKFAAQWVFPKYLGWWTLPYAGGKSAIETHIKNQSNIFYDKWINKHSNEVKLILKVVYPFEFEPIVENIDNKLIFGIIGPHSLYNNQLITDEINKII